MRPGRYMGEGNSSWSKPPPSLSKPREGRPQSPVGRLVEPRLMPSPQSLREQPNKTAAISRHGSNTSEHLAANDDHPGFPCPPGGTQRGHLIPARLDRLLLLFDTQPGLVCWPSPLLLYCTAHAENERKLPFTKKKNICIHKTQA